MSSSSRPGRRTLLALPVIVGMAASAWAAAIPTTGAAAGATGPQPGLAALGRELFFSTTAWGQRPSQGPDVAGQRLSCATCHAGPAYTDGKTHLVGPVAAQPAARRQTPHLFGLTGSAPYGWDGRNAKMADQIRGAIMSPLELNASRAPTDHELAALVEYLLTLTPPPARPGVDFDPARAARGKELFNQLRPVRDPGGEFGSNAKGSCATCHDGNQRVFSDGHPHRVWPTPLGDPADAGAVNRDRRSLGFETPALAAVRLTAPYFHDGGAGVPAAPDGPADARRSLRTVLLPFYNARFNFGFTDAELDDLTEFLLSL